MIPVLTFLTGLFIIRYNTLVNRGGIYLYLQGCILEPIERRVSHGSKEEYFNVRRLKKIRR